ncbi:hypothetical protein S40293_09841 [Stachybotrys chartarum IBT 40293]|nr:hypothetical protein S40293_09841 [Stachybotrys chartarum IBT 40293]
MHRLPYFTRLSIDEIVFEKYGLYGVDYPADQRVYDEYTEEADGLYMDSMIRLLKEGKDIIVDRAFYARSDRENVVKMINSLGGRRVFVFLKVEKELLWQRITSRSQQEKGANNALDISRELFDSYWDGFEWPCGEDEIVVDIE